MSPLVKDAQFSVHAEITFALRVSDWDHFQSILEPGDIVVVLRQHENASARVGCGYEVVATWRVVMTGSRAVHMRNIATGEHTVAQRLPDSDDTKPPVPMFHVPMHRPSDA